MYDVSVEILMEQMMFEFKRNDRGGIYAKTQQVMAYNSNKIEGSTLTEKQTANLFNTGLLDISDEMYVARDVEETTGHFIMFNEMLKDYKEELSEDIIKNYHKNLMSGVFEFRANGYIAGEYKLRPNIVGAVTTALPNEVPIKMKELLDWYRNEEKNLETFAKFHERYEKIHPFQDGNGRTGRMILFRECLHNGIMPLIISDSVKRSYYYALQIAHDKNDYSALTKLFKEEQEKYQKTVNEFLTPYDVLKGNDNTTKDLTDEELEC